MVLCRNNRISTSHLGVLAAQVGNGFEDSAGNNVALDFGESVVDLVEPVTISGRVMQRHLWMVGKEAIHELGFVGGEVVHDEVDFLVGGLSLRPRGESGQTPGWCGDVREFAI